MQFRRNLIIAFASCGLLLLVLSNFVGQVPTPGQSPSPSPAPSGSPTPSPTAASAPRPTPTPLPGAQNFHRWGSITVFNGLPSDSIRAIAQTPDGVMWFGTDNGLARFDGRRVQNLSFGGADADRVLALKVSPAGQLWIGTYKGAFTYSETGLQPIEGTQGIGITAILFGGQTLLATDTGHVLRTIDAGNGTLAAESIFTQPAFAEDGSGLKVTSLIEHNGSVLAGTPGGGVFEVLKGSPVEFQPAPGPLFVNSLAQSDEGKLWLGTDAAKALSGVYMVDSGSTAVRIAAPTANVLALEANEAGLWAGSERYGLFHINNSKLTKTYTFENTSGGLRSDTIFALFTDREGVLWIGTNRGVSRFDRVAPFQETVSDIPNSNFIRTLSRDGPIYAGSNRGLFVKVDDGADPWTIAERSRLPSRWTEVPGLRNRAVYALKQRGGADMLVGTSEGLFELSGRKLANGDFRGFATSNLKDYAAVFGRGVIDITGDNQRVVFGDASVTSVCGQGNKLWIGTGGNGLYSYDGRGVKLEAGPDLLKSGTIWNMFQGQPNGPLYIAGQHGVFALRDGVIEQIVTVEDVRDVVERDGQLWAATTTRGLLHARRDDRFGWMVSAIGFEQGLPSEKAFSIRPTGHGLMIATNRGIVTYRPGSVAPKLIPVRVLSQRVHDLGELPSGITLEYPQNSLLVEVAGQSSRTFPEEFQYGYLLKNSRDEIVDSRLSNDTEYAPRGLAPGEYRIESRAFNRDLLSSEPLTIRFSIAKAPFPWTATALAVLLAIAVIALIWAIVERRRIVAGNRELAAARFDLANEAERERSRIARDLHDQTLADLRNLMMMSDTLSPPNAEFRAEIESVSTEIRRICEDLSPSVLENVGLVSALEFLLSRSVKDHRFAAADDTNERVKFPLVVQLQIYRIAQEIITNINRHSDATRVEMSVEISDDDRFLMAICDNGTSFQPDGPVATGRGISNIRARADLINAKIAWTDRPEGGNRFCLEIAPGQNRER